MSFDAGILRLARLVSVHAGYPFRAALDPSGDGAVSVVQMKDVAPDSGVDWSAVIKTQLGGRRPPDWVRHGDILFAAKGARFYAACVTTPPEHTVCVPAFFVLRLKPQANVDAEFLAWQINQPPCQRQLLQAAEGSSQLSIRRPVLEQLCVAVPAMDAQRRIVALASIALRERRTLQRLIQNRERQLQSIAEHLGNAVALSPLQDQE